MDQALHASVWHWCASTADRYSEMAPPSSFYPPYTTVAVTDPTPSVSPARLGAGLYVSALQQCLDGEGELLAVLVDPAEEDRRPSGVSSRHQCRRTLCASLVMFHVTSRVQTCSHSVSIVLSVQRGSVSVRSLDTSILISHYPLTASRRHLSTAAVSQDYIASS